MTYTTKSATSELAVFALFFSLLILAAEVSGDEREDHEAGKTALRQFEEGKFDAVLPTLRRLANAGEALNYFRSAALNKSKEAMRELARCYKKGLLGLPKDDAKAAKWLERGQGSPPVDYGKKIADYTEAIRFDPKDATAYYSRGTVWKAKGDYDKAIADYNEALRLDPKYAYAYNSRGNAWKAKGDYDKAIADYNEALRLDPKYAYAYNNRGTVWKAKGDYDKEIADYNEALRLDPKYANAYNALAWLRATCADAKYRDGKQAVADATKACELTGWKDANNIDTLAAAYAEAGDFEKAVEWQTKAVGMVPESRISSYQKSLNLYRAAKPYREE